MAKKERHPISLKLEKETHKRLIEASERTGIAKHTLAQMAIEAAIDAIEKGDYSIVLPIEFDVKRVAKPKGDTEISFPNRIEENGSKAKKGKK